MPNSNLIISVVYYERNIEKIFGFLSVLVVLTSCSRFLDEKSDSQLATPKFLKIIRHYWIE